MTVIEAEEADAVEFSQLLSPTDLPQRFASDAPLNQPDAATCYSTGPEGYIDYPALQG